MSSTGPAADFFKIPDAGAPKPVIGIAWASWNHEVIMELRNGARKIFKTAGIPEKNIIDKPIPGSYELPLATQWMFENSDCDAVICFGCLVRGETPHFDYISQSVTQGIKDVMLKFNRPVIFGVLTVENLEQAIERVGGAHGHKGEEAALTVLHMLKLKEELKNNS